MHKILFEGNDLALSVKYEDHPISIITFEARDQNLNPNEKNPYGAGFGLGMFAPLKMNEFIIHRNKNNWYQTKDIISIIEIINSINKANCTLTYGVSMGAFAAINFAPLLNATKFIAFSPLFDVAPGNQLGDDRWAIDMKNLDFIYNFIRSGVCKNSRGFVFFDRNSKDKGHADLLGEFTGATLMPLEFGGHPCTFYLNSTYKLKNIINEIAYNYFEKNNFYKILENLTSESYYVFERSANKLIKDGDFGSAVEQLLVAINKKPDLERLRINIAEQYLKLKRFDEAKDAFEAAISLNPENEKPYVRLSYVFAEKKDYENAVRSVESAVRIKPNDSKIHFRLGEWRLLAGDLQGAERAMLKVIELTPDAVVAPARIKSIRDKLKKFEKPNQAVSAHT